MTSYQEVEPFILTTDANSNKNLGSQVYTFNQPLVTVAAGSYQRISYTIPLSSETRFYQIYVNLSIDSGEWTSIPCRDRFYSNNRIISMNLSQSGTTVTLDVYYISGFSSTQTFGPLVISVAKRDFVDEVI